jgi:hypothetical protein
MHQIGERLVLASLPCRESTLISKAELKEAAIFGFTFSAS